MIIDFLFQAQLITLLGIILSSCIFGWITLQQSNWKWFQNDAAEPVTALANENTKPTLVNLNIIRCRVRIDCSGTSGSAIYTLSMEYSTDNTNWYEFGTLRDTRVPTSDSVAQWTPSSGVDHYALVDEYPAINDADYNYSVTYNAADSFGFTAFAIPAGATISNVNLRIRAKRNTQNRDLLFGLKIHGDHWWTGVGISATSFTEYIATWITNPHSEQAWTVDDVNGVGTNGIQEFAYLCGYAVNGDALYVSSAYLEVCYVISPIIWDYDDGLATEGVPTTTYLLTGTDAHKAYFESDSYPETFTVGNLAELDFTIKPTGNIGNLKTYYFRILGDGVALDLVAGKTHPQILTGTAADRRALPLFLP